MKNKILLFNPRAARAKPRIPNSILSIASSIDHNHEWVIVDGNLEADPWLKISFYLESGDFRYFGCTVMPGPQLKQAIPFTNRIRKEYPDIITIWGGYFPSNHYKVVMASGTVDYIINGPGENAFPRLLNALEKHSEPLDQIGNLIYKNTTFTGKQDTAGQPEIIVTHKDELADQDLTPQLPYEKLDGFYPIRRYLGKTCLGKKTIAYHSSVGCPFTCSFCAVVPVYNARWKGRSAENIFRDIKFLKEKYGGDAIEFHDNNFFVSEKRTAEFARLIKPEKMTWWGEGRIDTIDKYSDSTISLMRESGCTMIFFGAETGNDERLKKMDKGGTQSAKVIRSFAARMKRFDIIPEYSFVLGTPAGSEAESWKQIYEDVAFIREIKEINPSSEIIIYVYSPVPVEGTSLYNEVLKTGFRYPENLEEWIQPQWENFDLRKNPLTPWLTPEMVDYIRNFETVLNGYYPSVSDIRLNSIQVKALRAMSALRYHSGWYHFPLEIKALQKIWKYRQPEIEGF